VGRPTEGAPDGINDGKAVGPVEGGDESAIPEGVADGAKVGVRDPQASFAITSGENE
jgi:hypothetical protein